MTPKRKQRLILVCLMLAGVGLATFVGLKAFKESITLFHSPSDIAAGKVNAGTRFRVGGMVVENSVQRRSDNLDINFELTDRVENVAVSFNGILPDLFREGQGIVAMGQLNDSGVFVASEVLAKHDENYMPPEVAEALEKAGKMPGTSEDFGVKSNYGVNTLVQP